MRFERLNEEINKSDTTIVWDGTYNVGKAWDYVEDVINVIIQDGVEKIRSGAFCNCINLKSVTIPNSVKYIEHAAFNNCRSLESIVIPNSVKEISTDVFGDCVLLRNIQLPNTLTRIDTQAFMGCISLKSVVIPASVKYISYDAFQWCDSLEEIILKNPNTVYEENSFPEHTRIIKKGVNENMKFRTNESVDSKRSKRLLENDGYKVVQKDLNEVVSESDFIDPMRVMISVKPKEDDDYHMQQAIDFFNKNIHTWKLGPEVLIDNSDGTYQLCFPGINDWINKIKLHCEESILDIQLNVIGRKNTIHESLSEDDYDDFLHKIYNDLVKVMYKYRYKYNGISQDDFEMAIEFFINHFFENDDYWVN